MTAWDALWEARHLLPAALVERDAAREACEEPPCRALVVAGPMAGDWCWLTIAAGRSPSILRRPFVFDKREWFVYDFDPGTWDSTGGINTNFLADKNELTPLYRRWSPRDEPAHDQPDDQSRATEDEGVAL